MRMTSRRAGIRVFIIKLGTVVQSHPDFHGPIFGTPVLHRAHRSSKLVQCNTNCIYILEESSQDQRHTHFSTVPTFMYVAYTALIDHITDSFSSEAAIE